MFLIVFFIIAIVSREYLFVLPVLLVEMGMCFWYIYSLGIRKGVRYIILFNIVRMTRVWNIANSLIKNKK